MAVDVSEVFFTEEDYERFSLRPKFDVNLFKAYNPSIEGCTISPVKTRQAQVKNAEASKQGATVQQEKKAPLSNAPKKNVTPGVGEKTPTVVWNLKSPKNHFPYPRYSCITHAQQQRYIELWQKHGQRHPNQTRYATTPGDIAEKQQLRKLQILVHQEQQEFMKYARHVARCSPKDYKHLPPAAQQYAKDQWLIQDQRVKQLPQHFSVCQTIGIVPAAVFLTDPVLTFSARLLCVGQPRVVDQTTLDSKVNQNLILASSRYGHQKKANGRDISTTKDMGMELSSDENAVKLAAKYQANIVIATAALATLADNHAPEYDKNWRIPVQIKLAKTADTDSTLKTVYISDPLTNSSFPHEVSQAFHRVALLDLMEGLEGLSSPGGPDSASVEVDKQYDDYLEFDLTSLETFGSLPSKSRLRNAKDSQIQHKAKAERKLSESETKDRACLPADAQTIATRGANVEESKFTGGTSLNGNQHGSPKGSLESTTNRALGAKSSAALEVLPDSFEMLQAVRIQKAKQSQMQPSGTLPKLASFGSEEPVAKPGIDPQIKRESLDESEELLFLSDGTEGELMIELSSGPDSPVKPSNSQLTRKTETTGVRDISKEEKETCGENLKGAGTEDAQQSCSVRSTLSARKREVCLGVASEEAPTPRRSLRLQKNPPADVKCQAPLLYQPLSKTPKEVLPEIQIPAPTSEDPVCGENSYPAIPSREAARGVIPDSPLSPPPHEKGLATGVSFPPASTSTPIKGSLLVGKRLASDSFTKNTCQALTPAPESLQMKKRRTAGRCAADHSVAEDKPCMRYNLRSKSSGSGYQDQQVVPGPEIPRRELRAGGNDSVDKSLTSTEIPTSELDDIQDEVVTKEQQEAFNAVVPEENQTMPWKSHKDSAKFNEHESRSPRKSHALNKRHVLQAEEMKTGAESTVDSILKLQERLHSSKATHQSPPQPPVSAPVGSMQMNAQGDGCLEDASDYKMPSKGSIDYSLWRFGRHLLVIKNNIDAVTANYAESNLNKMQVATILPKLEYQPHFGYEQISMSELIKLWMSLLLQPGSKVIQGRVNALTSDLMMLEQFDMNSALWEQPSFQPSRCLKMMFQVLDKLASLPEGPYLLCHSAGDMHACILQTATPTAKRSVFDLHKSYSQLPMMQSCPPQQFPWLPLDTNLYLPGHITTGRIPATFPPKNTGKNAKGGVTMGSPKKKPKKKKKAGKR